MVDVNALASALREEGRTTANVKGLEEQMAEALALRNTGRPEARSFLSGLVANVDRQRGREMVGELQPQLDFARQQAADAGNAQALYNAQVAADNTAYQRGQDKLDREWREGANDRAFKLWSAKRDAQSSDIKGAGTTYVKADGTDPITVYMTRSGPVDSMGEPVDLYGRIPYNKPTASGKGSKGGNSEDKDPTGNYITMLKESFTDKYANPGGGFPKAGSLSNYMAREFPGMSNDEMLDRQAWWRDFKMFYELPQRHELFGSALTKTEQAQWESATITPDMNPEQIKSGLKVLESIYNNVAQRTGVNPFAEYKPSDMVKGGVPEGVNAEDWNDLTAEEQAEYTERFLR